MEFRRVLFRSIAIIVVFIGKPLLLLLAGPAYEAAYPLLVLLGIAAAIDLIGVTYEPLLMATGRMNWSVKIRLFNAVLLVVILTIRSEEHTSELQSLMRISYAVFCLKKKQIQKHLNQ